MYLPLFGALVVLIFFAAVFTREVIAPASAASCDRRWQILATSLNVSQLLVALLLGYVFQSSLADTSILHLANHVGPLVGGFVSFLVASFLAYWWHRASHRFDWIWRVFHQLHHSPSRIEVHTSFFLHPLDTAAATAVSCLACYLLLGLTYQSAAVALTLASLFNLYIHSDTSSPSWLGFFVQRPEMHRVHHMRDHHADNYGLPVWDLLFGTWKNPTERVEECGFSADRADRITDMLLGRDVHA